jgi:hypothetical protein
MVWQAPHSCCGGRSDIGNWTIGTWMYKVYLSLVPEYILGVDVLQGLWLGTGRILVVCTCSKNSGVRASTPPFSLCASACTNSSCEIMQVARTPWKITGTTAELEKAKIIHPAHSPYNSPIWPVWKPYGTWNLPVDYQGPNKVTPPLHAPGPLAKDILDQLALVDLGNAFFSIDSIVPKSQDQCIFTWQLTSEQFWCSLKDMCIVWHYVTIWLPRTLLLGHILVYAWLITLMTFY